MTLESYSLGEEIAACVPTRSLSAAPVSVDCESEKGAGKAAWVGRVFA